VELIVKYITSISLTVFQLQLQTFDFHSIDGCDPSIGMVEQARPKRVYRNLICQGMSKESLNICDGNSNIPCLCLTELIYTKYMF